MSWTPIRSSAQQDAISAQAPWGFKVMESRSDNSRSAPGMLPFALCSRSRGRDDRVVAEDMESVENPAGRAYAADHESLTHVIAFDAETSPDGFRLGTTRSWRLGTQVPRS